MVEFDKNHFDGRAIDPFVVEWHKTLNASWLAGSLDEWWKKISLENHSIVDPVTSNQVWLHMVEIARNTFEKVGSGVVKAIFDQNQITIIVEDNGIGFQNSDEINRAIRQQGHGLFLVSQFADDFTIETNGIKYARVKNVLHCIEDRDTAIQRGTKITFTKKLISAKHPQT